MKNKLSENNVLKVLKADGVKVVDIQKYQNSTMINFESLVKELGANKSWAARLAYNKNFGGVMIQQLPGEGNRIHKHPKNDECWVILKGQWKWIIEGKDEMEVSVGSVINVPANTFHQIKCIGSEPGIRYAITAPDVDHVYKE